MKQSKQTPAHVGSGSILLIFTVLSLISFSALTMVNSKADYNLSQKLAGRQTAYYNACHQGNAFVAAVNSGYVPEGKNAIMEESIPIADNQSLDIALIPNLTNSIGNSDNSYIITRWKIVNYENDGYDYTLPVFTGG